MTKKVLDRLEAENKNVFCNIKSLKAWYNSNKDGRACVLAEIRGYLTGLLHGGIITEQEKRVIFCYITL